jgi:S1-C subfamily serine protease
MKRICLYVTIVFFLALTVPVFADQAPEEVLKAVVKIRAIVPKEARTAASLGTERIGCGVLIDSKGLVLKVNGKPVEGYADFYRKVWALGNAGVEVTLSILRGAEIRDITVRSVDRYKFLQRPPKRTIHGPVDTNREFRSKSS